MGFFSFLKKEPNILKEMGFTSDQNGIIERYGREKEGWDIHLHNSKQAIVEAVNCYHPKSISILGSGWLLDVPIEELSKKCSKVYLYDIVHPAQVKHLVSKYKNVECIEADITGGAIAQTWFEVQLLRNEGSQLQLEKIAGNSFEPKYQTDMIVSLNILNQLDILICDYLLSMNAITNDELSTLRILLQQKHIESISKQPFCLISDFEELIIDIKTNKSDTRPLVVVPFPHTNYQKQWLWKFDSSGNYYEGKRVTFNVQALF